ncbi:TonB-linked SusC/RagA family outer membrane protein [Chitinophaga dinghuensis]|uniref:TonB-linked SusC/RagA family outer membrane protein n=1 Tax=Chitinophaga dinghuensis TaxID=1539050 RepID=A0A327VUC8_9BACT|nr:TonB-dependent receptor [Chitinophaga dinghuensis]RAJ79092.1 TonB-linked SusC/RagA family outer membrane protein [Chitinophaga dinghuensis]
MQKFSLKFCVLALTMLASLVTYAQQKALPVTEALEQITRTYGTKFVYGADVLINKKTATAIPGTKTLPVEEVLKQVLYPNNLLFVYVSSNTYMIIDRPAGPVKKVLSETSTPQETVGATTDAANKTLIGYVADAGSKEPLPGVTVRLMPVGTGAVTDQSGRVFFPHVPAGTQYIVISMVGYVQRQEPFTGNNFGVALEQNTKTLDEVNVVEVGYGTKRKEAITSAVSSVGNKTITQMPTPILSNALIGTVPGLFGKQMSGVPGRDQSRMIVRGSDFTKTALIVIDGVPLNENSNTGGMSGQASLGDLDPADIESVTVLKDAGATAIYGSRGGNGVILVTTKRGKQGVPKFSFLANSTWSQPTQQPKFVGSFQQALLENEYAVNSGKIPVYTDAQLDTIRLGLNPDKFANTDWLKEGTLKFAKGQNYNLNVSGGNTGVKYYVSGGYNNQGSLIKNDAYKRYTVISNVDARLNKNLTMGLDMRYVYENVNDVPAGGANNILNNLYQLSPLQPVYFSNGLPAANYTGSVMNPILMANQSGYARNYANYLNAKFKMDYSIPWVKGLGAHAMASFDRNNYGSKTFTVPYKLYRANAAGVYIPVMGVDSKGADLKPSLTQATSRNNYTNMELGLNYNRSFGLHNLSGILLYTLNSSYSESLSGGRSSLFTPSVDQLFAGDASASLTNSGSAQEFGRVSYIGRLGYSWNARYYLDASFRTEASVNYPEGHRWGTFPSISASWRISEENFLKGNASWLDELKLRASYGMAGDETGAGYSSYLYNFSVGQNSGPASSTGKYGYIFNGSYVPSIYPGSLAPNTNITWGTIKSFNAGLNVSILKGLFAASFDVYRKNNINVLISSANNVPLTFGATAPRVNLGRSHTSGYELKLSHTNSIGKNFNYYVTAVAAHTKTIIDFSGEQSGLPAWDERQQNGWGVNNTRIYHALGLFQTREEINNWADQDGRKNATINPGDIKYADLNGDGVIDQKDVIVKDNTAMPLFNYTLSLGGSWKQFELDLTFQGVGDYTTLIGSKRWTNYDTRQLDRWTPDNPNASWPKLGSIASDSRNSDFYGLNGNYLRLRSARLSYSLAPVWIKHIGFDAVTINLQGGNLFVISKVKFTDPENDNPSFYGAQKTYSVGLNVKF